MIDLLFRTTGICLAASVLVAVLRRTAPELGVVLAIAVVLACAALLVRAASGIEELGGELVELTGLSPSLFAPLIKVTAIALVVRVGSALCADAGQSALGRVIELAGSFCALGCAVPLLRSVLELIRAWL